MPAGTGRLIKFKISDGASPPIFNNIGARSVACRINGQAIEITDNDGDGWRELLDGGGVRSLSVTIQGAYRANATKDFLLRQKANTQELFAGQMAFEGMIEYSGQWQCTSFELGGQVDGAQAYQATIESSGSMVLG